MDNKFQKLLNKVAGLPQTTETWSGTTRMARSWIFPRKSDPYRPYHILLADENSFLLRAAVSSSLPTAEEVWEALLHAMRRPMIGAGSPRRPKIILLDDSALVEQLSDRLSGLGIEAHFQPNPVNIREVIADVEKIMNRNMPSLPGLLSIPRVTIPLLEQIFASAASLYQLAPWKLLHDEVPIRLQYPLSKPSRYIVITGLMGKSFGLSINDNQEDLKLMFSRIRPRKLAKQVSWLMLTYETAPNISFDDLEIIETYHLPVAHEQAYPFMARIGKPADLYSPTTQDLFWLEGALPALVEYFEHHFKTGSNGVVQPETHTLSIGTLDGQQQVQLQIPAELE